MMLHSEWRGQVYFVSNGCVGGCKLQVFGALRSLAARQLAAYPTTVEEDEAVLRRLTSDEEVSCHGANPTGIMPQASCVGHKDVYLRRH